MLGGKYCRGAYERSANKGNDVLRKLHTGHKMGVRNGITVECRLIDLLSCIRSPQYIAMPVISIKQPLGDFAESHEEKSAEQQEPLLEIKRPPLYERYGT